ncbi:MAG TPA: M20/M25/M40 family metallo-hydrolase [Solirubrobacteraceae bacterium]|jgi:acetylornithine deacetylase/succinyl-diaminopimelate desuccinylase-like protein|nr:M20/M25/M40 family metallo-hydrolase [Solirubrobacteraceae bacterium]
MSDAAHRVIDDARAICAVPAPTFAEGPRGELVAELFAGAGVTPDTDAAGNVVAQVGDGPAERTLVLAAHLDTVFEAGTAIAFDEQDGRLAAPGIGDNSLAVASLVHLARRLAGRPLDRPVLLAATVGEEGLGDLRGAKALVAERPCAAFVAVEGMTLDTITTAAVGSLRFRVTVRGPGGHPWSDHGTPSAVHGLVDVLATVLDAVTDPHVVLNVGVIHGGTVINAIAGQASAEIDLRCEDEATLRRAGEQVRAATAGLEPGLTVALDELGHRPGGRIASDHELLAAARRARGLAGLPPAPETASSTDANAAHGRGIPAITVGITTGDNAHRLDEYIDLAPVPAGLAALDALVEELTR